MKNTVAEIEERRKRILSIIESRETAGTKELASALNVTGVTIRKDLDELAEAGRVKRIFGGARRLSSLAPTVVKNSDEDDLTRQRRALARAAAQTIKQDEVILLNSSSTVSYLLEYTNDIPITIISNNASAFLRKISQNTLLILTGGQILSGRNSMTGPYAIETIKRNYVSKCILGVRGISVKGGITSAVLEEATINKTMIEQTSGPVIVVAASNKIGRDDSFRICGLNEIDYFVTDNAISETDRADFERNGVHVIIAPPLLSSPALT